MVTLTKDDIIKDGNYSTQLICWGIFAISGIGVPLLSITNVAGEVSLSNPNFVVGFLIMLAFFMIPFGYFLGIRNIIKALKEILSIKKGDFFIAKMKVVDKYEGHDKYLVYFDKLDKGLYIRWTDFKKIRKGDNVYGVFLGEYGSISRKNLCGTFNTRNYTLDSELQTKLMG